MDKENKSEAGGNCEDDIPLLEVRRSPEEVNRETQSTPDAAAAENNVAQKAVEKTILSVPTVPLKTDQQKKTPTNNKPPSSVIQFSNPEGNGQKIKVDMAQSSLVGSGKIEPARKLDLEANADDDIALGCDEKIGDSPELEKKMQSKTANIKTEPSASVVEDLLKPLQMDKSEETKTDIKFALNEFGLIEVPQRMKEVKKDVTASPRKDSNIAKKIQDDNILCCEGCGCYGMAGEFVAQNSCSTACNRTILDKVREKQRKERDALKQKQRREAKGKEAISLPKTSHYNESYPWHDDENGFNWQKYLEWSNSKAAPVTLFRHDPFPSQHNFTKGLKLEAIDPLSPSFICVVSIVEVTGPRMRLHFDGYSDSYDFWENVNSDNLFPVGWCKRNNQTLRPPKGFTPTNFDWTQYLSVTKCEGAEEELFKYKSKQKPVPDGWKVGGKLEVSDPDKPELIHVATVANIIEARVLIHFDGWSHNYDFWSCPTSSYLKPVGWCAENKKTVTPPLGGKDTVTSFSWPSYLSSTASQPVPRWAFKKEQRTEFGVGMRLEAVDIRNPSLVRVASVAAVNGRRVKVHYDGWPAELDVWLDDQSGDLHPCGWAATTGHNLMSALTPEEVKYWAGRGLCPTPGCRGLGHIKGARYTSHHSVSACPYAKQNLDNEEHLPDRLHDHEKMKDGVKSEVDKMDDSVVPVVVGKTGRRRRKRKFFDEDTDKADDEKAAKVERRESQESKTSIDRTDSRASGSTDTSRDRNDQETQTTTVNGVKEEEKVGNTFETEWEENVRKTVFQPGYLPQPFPVGALPFNWSEHSRLLIGRKAKTAKDKVKGWSTAQVCDFIGEIPNIDHGSISNKLTEEEIDGESMLSLTQSDLTSILEIKLGPAIKIYNAITALKLKP